jgi:hypothetical protein
VGRSLGLTFYNPPSTRLTHVPSAVLVVILIRSVYLTSHEGALLPQLTVLVVPLKRAV